MKKLMNMIWTLALSSMIGSVHAATVSIDPFSQPVVAGNSVSFNIIVDFSSTATSKGWFDLSYDPSLLGFSSFIYNVPFTSDVTTIGVNTATSGLIKNIGFVGAKATSGTLGTVTFSTTDPGTAALNTVATYGFRNSADTSFLSMTYNGGTAQISAVPVPAALWLMASGLSALGLAFRRRT